MDLGAMLKMKGAWDKFTRNHPKFPAFIEAVKRKGVYEGTVIEIKITGPEGESIESNIKVTAEDMELFRSLG